MARIPLISFFTGGGFLDLGLEKAGFAVVWTNEIDNAFADMYEAAMTIVQFLDLLAGFQERRSVRPLRYKHPFYQPHPENESGGLA